MKDKITLNYLETEFLNKSNDSNNRIKNSTALKLAVLCYMLSREKNNFDEIKPRYLIDEFIYLKRYIYEREGIDEFVEAYKSDSKLSKSKDRLFKRDLSDEVNKNSFNNLKNSTVSNNWEKPEFKLYFMKFYIQNNHDQPKGVILFTEGIKIASQIISELGLDINIDKYYNDIKYVINTKKVNNIF